MQLEHFFSPSRNSIDVRN